VAEPEYAVDDNGMLIPPSFEGAPSSSVPRPPLTPSYESAAMPSRPLTPLARRAPEPLPPAGRLNWIFGVLGILTGLASFLWPLVCLTVLVSLTFSAFGISRANRLRRRGANGRAVAVVGLVIGLASAANLVFGFTQLFELQSQLSGLLP